MWKLLLSMSLASLILLSIGTTLYPNSSAFWLASGAMPYQVARGVLGLILLEQLFTSPPRQIWFRIIAGLGSVAGITWALIATYNYQMPLFDMVAFIAAGIAVGITALEKRETNEVLSWESRFGDHSKRIS